MNRPTRILYPDGRKGRIAWKRCRNRAVYGNFEELTGDIEVNVSQPPETHYRTLVHEMTHNFLLDANLGELEEGLTRSLERAICGSMRLNPELWRWLIAEAERDE